MSRKSPEFDSSPSNTLQNASAAATAVPNRPPLTVGDLLEMFPPSAERPVINAVGSRMRRMPNRREYLIHAVQSLGQFIDNIQNEYIMKKIKKESRNERLSEDKNRLLHTIRYILTENDELLFAKEGVEPPHFIMPKSASSANGARCRCAGNLIFNEDFSKIVMVNNSSGDFEPPPESLKDVLLVLWVLHEKNLIVLDDFLEMKLYSKSQQHGVSYEISLQTLGEFVSRLYSLEERNNFLTVNRGARARTVVFDPQNRRSVFGGATSHDRVSRGRLSLQLFGDSDDEGADLGVGSAVRVLDFDKPSMGGFASASGLSLLDQGEMDPVPVAEILSEDKIYDEDEHDRKIDKDLFGLFSSSAGVSQATGGYRRRNSPLYTKSSHCSSSGGDEQRKRTAGHRDSPVSQDLCPIDDKRFRAEERESPIVDIIFKH